MNNYQGVIIEESLESKAVLKKIKIISTKVAPVTERDQTPWINQWTLHTVEIPISEMKDIAEEISQSLDRTHGGSWYADFKNETHHYIIFRNKIFYIERKNQEQYDEARRYGISLGIPKHQVSFKADNTKEKK